MAPELSNWKKQTHAIIDKILVGTAGLWLGTIGMMLFVAIFAAIAKVFGATLVARGALKIAVDIGVVITGMVAMIFIMAIAILVLISR
jgi:hypothetical protein